MRKAAPLGPPPFSGHTLMTDPGLPEASPGWTSKIALASWSDTQRTPRATMGRHQHSNFGIFFPGLLEGRGHSLSFRPFRDRKLCRRGLSFSLLPGQNWPDAKTRRAVHPFGPQSGDHNVICRSDARRLYQPRRWDLDAVLH